MKVSNNIMRKVIEKRFFSFIHMPYRLQHICNDIIFVYCKDTDIMSSFVTTHTNMRINTYQIEVEHAIRWKVYPNLETTGMVYMLTDADCETSWAAL